MGARTVFRSFLFINAALLFAAVSGQTASMPTRPLELTAEQKESLWATACYMQPQSIETRQQYGGPVQVDRADVYCGPHAEYEGQPVALFVQCSRPSGSEHWQCDKAVPMIDIRDGDRTIRVRYTFVTAREVSEIMRYVLSLPSLGNVTVRHEWIDAGVYIHRINLLNDRFSVSMDKLY